MRHASLTALAAHLTGGHHAYSVNIYHCPLKHEMRKVGYVQACDAHGWVCEI